MLFTYQFDFLEPAPQKKSKSTKKRRKTKSIYKRVKKIVIKRTEFTQCAAVEPSADEIYTFNDDAEEDLCVVELPASTIYEPCALETDHVVEMTAADKLKSQTAPINAASGKINSKKKRRRGSGTSSEEERWLVAIESGKLEQVDEELKKIKDPKLMTARQRAMYERNIEKEPSPGGGGGGIGFIGDCNALKALPTGSKEKILSAEAIEKAQLKSQKRKQLADEKREKNKRETMDRLLKKQEVKVTKVIKSKIVKVEAPVISYYDSITNGTHVSYPIDMEVPIKAQLQRTPPAIILCGVCNEEKKRYNCSKTNLPLCSIQCYRLNLERQKISQ